MLLDSRKLKASRGGEIGEDVAKSGQGQRLLDGHRAGRHDVVTTGMRDRDAGLPERRLADARLSLDDQRGRAPAGEETLDHIELIATSYDLAGRVRGRVTLIRNR
jgi:hypothetical protein